MGEILPSFRTKPVREWTDIPPDERTALFGSLTAVVAVPLLLTLVIDTTGDLLRPLIRWLFWMVLPVGVLARVVYRWLDSGESLAWAVLRDLRPTPSGGPLVLEGGPLRRLPVLTIALVAANVAIHYSVADPLDYAMRMGDPSLWLWTNFTSMFAHMSDEHLWGNMLFLWVFASEIEPRLGRARTLLYYLVLGTAGNVLSVVFYSWVVGDDRIVTLGASGAISGVMGLFIVRCYFARVGVAVPIFGPLGAALPIAYRLQVNALVLIGLYFCLDLLGARSQLEGDPSSIDQMAHLGGYCSGLCIAFGTGLVREGRREMLALLASRPPDPEGFGPDHAARDRVLERDPSNVALRIARARTRSKFALHEGGREDYEAAIRLLAKRDLSEAARVFAEFFGKYTVPLSPKEQLALTPALERLGKLDLAARALELAAEVPGIEADRERALLRQAMLLEAMGISDAAVHVYEKLLREHPSSRVIVEAKLARCRAASAAGAA